MGLLIVANIGFLRHHSLAAGRSRPGVGLADGRSQQVVVGQDGAVDQHPWNVVMGRSGQSALVLDSVGLVGSAISDSGPAQARVGHGGGETVRCSAGASFVQFHALNEGPSFQAVNTSRDSSDIIAQLVQGAQLQDIAGALINTVLAGE